MEYTDLLTIAMPVYKRKDYFLEALESAINQTVKCEVIVVDNCSPHNYFKDVCEEKGITYYRNQTNVGMCRNFNRCFELAKTDYVITLQDDDILAPTYVESFLKAKEQYPDIDVFFADFVCKTSKGNIPHNHTLPFGYMSNGKKVIEYGIKYKLGFPYLNSSIRRSKFTGFYTKYNGSVDWLWVYENADKLTFFGDKKVLYQFRDHEKQETKENNFKNSFTVPYVYDVILKEKDVDKYLKKRAASNAFWSLVQIKAETGSSAIEEFIKEDHIFSEYLKTKLESNKLMKTIFYSPRIIVNVWYKSLRKLNLIN